MTVEKSWIVVGAGPAGITAISALLDHQQTNILWIDPEYKVGNLSQYLEVPGNTIIRLLESSFFESSPSFGYTLIKSDYSLCKRDGNDYCMLGEVVDILLRISNNLKKRNEVEVVQSKVIDMVKRDNQWHVKDAEGVLYTSERVILAIGAVPRTLNLDFLLVPKEITLVDALTPSKLKKDEFSKVAVFGSSHSAILAIMNLINLGIPVISIYKSDILFASIQKNGYENWFTGLKGVAAAWATDNIVDDLNPLLTRIHFNDCASVVNECSHVVFAAGFTRNSFCIDGVDKSGIFGTGIAFPEKIADCNGKIEDAIGFVNFLQSINSIIIKNK